jgi:simple sugar transport system substrate-binding protein
MSKSSTNGFQARPWWRPAAILIALVFAIAACGPAASPTPGGSAAPSAAQFCKGMKIVFFPGGTPGGGFETVVYDGAKAAEAAFGPTVTYQWSDWDPNKMITQFKEAVATNPDGIAIMGHPGSAAFAPLVDDAESKGILVTSSNTQLQEIQAKYATAGFGYVGAVLYDAGHALGVEAVKRGGLKSGDRAMVWGLLAQPGRGQRTQGIVDALKEAGLTVDYLEIDDATNTDPANGVPVFTGYASAHPDVKLAVFDHGNVTSTIPTYMKAANLQPGSVYTAGFDLSSATVKGIKDGYINLVIDQQQYLQGFMSVLQLCLTHFYGFSGLMINTGGGFADKSNIDVLAPLVEQQIR